MCGCTLKIKKLHILLCLALGSCTVRLLKLIFDMHVQWNLLIRDTLIQRALSLIQRLSFIGRFFRKSRIMTSNHHCRTENLSAVLCSSGSTIQHQAVGMHPIQTIPTLKKSLTNMQRTTVPDLGTINFLDSRQAAQHSY